MWLNPIFATQINFKVYSIPLKVGMEAVKCTQQLDMSDMGCFTTIFITKMVIQVQSALWAHEKHMITQLQMSSVSLGIFLGKSYCQEK